MPIVPSLSDLDSDDYVSVSSDVTYDSDTQRQCIVADILEDDFLENVELFQFLLTTDDVYATLSPNVANVSILDTNGKWLSKCLYFLLSVNSCY